MHALTGGFIGAAALTTIHQTARAITPDAPRMDIVGERAIAGLYGLFGCSPPEEGRLYAMTLAGDLVSNAVYYSMIGLGARSGKRPRYGLDWPPRHEGGGSRDGNRALWLRAVALGLAAGVGAVVLPERMGLGRPPHGHRRSTQVMTVAWYLAGALVTAAVLSRSRDD